MSVASRTKFVHVQHMKSESLVQFKLMLPADLKKRIEERATENRRTLSQEIVSVLERAFPTDEQLIRMSQAAQDLAQLVQEFDGEEREVLMPLVRKKIERELSSLERLRDKFDNMGKDAE